jgi:hypothetical protein
MLNVGDFMSPHTREWSRHDFAPLARPRQAVARRHICPSPTLRDLPAALGDPGFISASILRRNVQQGIEFLVVTTWESTRAIERFAGRDAELAVVPDDVQQMNDRVRPPSASLRGSGLTPMCSVRPSHGAAQPAFERTAVSALRLLAVPSSLRSSAAAQRERSAHQRRSP